MAYTVYTQSKHYHGNVLLLGFTLSHSFIRCLKLKYVTGNNLISVFG